MTVPFFRWAAVTDRGGRGENQDSWGVRQIRNTFLAVVADGLGGQIDGSVASRLAVNATLDWASTHWSSDVDALVNEAVTAANQAVLAERTRRKNDLATTIVVLAATPEHAAWAHVGDSRLYRLRSGTAERMTIDHSLAMATRPIAERATADVRGVGGRNMLAATLGQTDPLIDSRGEDRLPGDGYALCSDGYWESSADGTLFCSIDDPAKAVACAVVRNGTDGDNATLLIVNEREPQ